MEHIIKNGRLRMEKKLRGCHSTKILHLIDIYKIRKERETPKGRCPGQFCGSRVGGFSLEDVLRHRRAAAPFRVRGTIGSQSFSMSRSAGAPNGRPYILRVRVLRARDLRACVLRDDLVRGDVGAAVRAALGLQLFAEVFVGRRGRLVPNRFRCRGGGGMGVRKYLLNLRGGDG